MNGERIMPLGLARGQPGMDRQCHQSTEVAVTHQPKHCPTSTEDEMSPVSRSNTDYLWGGWGSNPRPKDYESSALTD